MALDREGPAIRFRFSDRCASTRSRYDLRRPTRSRDAHVPRRRSSRVAQRERWRDMEPPGARTAEEGNVFHGAARRDGHRRSEIAGAVLRHDDRSAMGWQRRRRKMGVRVRGSTAGSLREGGGGVEVASRESKVARLYASNIQVIVNV